MATVGVTILPIILVKAASLYHVKLPVAHIALNVVGVPKHTGFGFAAKLVGALKAA